MWKNSFIQVAQKGSDTRRPKLLGMMSSYIYIGMTRDEGKAVRWAFFSIRLIIHSEEE
jgi:hypothetical protein